MEDILTVCIAASLCYDIFSVANTTTTTMCQNGTQLPNLEDTTQIIKSINATLPAVMNFLLREELWGGHLQCSLDMARKFWKIFVIADRFKWSHLICTSANSSAIAQPSPSSSPSLAWLWVMLVLLTLGVSLGCVVLIYINKIRHKAAAPNNNNDNNNNK